MRAKQGLAAVAAASVVATAAWWSEMFAVGLVMPYWSGSGTSLGSVAIFMAVMIVASVSVVLPVFAWRDGQGRLGWGTAAVTGAALGLGLLALAVWRLQVPLMVDPKKPGGIFLFLLPFVAGIGAGTIAGALAGWGAWRATKATPTPQEVF